MKLTIQHQAEYSRGELLLRTFFGYLYIMIPHIFLLFFVAIWAAILMFLTFFIVLFTGKYPRDWFDFQVKFMNWQMRLNATLFNLVDGYPAFLPDGTSDKVKLEVEYPEKVNQLLVLLRAFFGSLFVGIPHGFCLFFRSIGGMVLYFLAWWVVLFTGKYPEDWHEYNVGTFRWEARVGAYMMFMTDVYPPFSGKE